jgi:hypothetical protein
MTTTYETVRAQALFASSLQPSQRPTPTEVRAAIAATLRNRGAPGCAAAVATEYGDHPETASARMAWALATVRALTPTLVGAA